MKLLTPSLLGTWDTPCFEKPLSCWTFESEKPLLFIEVRLCKQAAVVHSPLVSFKIWSMCCTLCQLCFFQKHNNLQPTVPRCCAVSVVLLPIHVIPLWYTDLRFIGPSEGQLLMQMHAFLYALHWHSYFFFFWIKVSVGCVHHLSSSYWSSLPSCHLALLIHSLKPAFKYALIILYSRRYSCLQRLILFEWWIVKLDIFLLNI